MCDYIFHNHNLLLTGDTTYHTSYLSPKSVLFDVKLPDSGDERMRLGAAITDSSHNNPGVFASGPLPQIQSVLSAPHSIGTKSDRFSSLLPKELGNSFGSCNVGPGAGARG